MLEIAFVVNSCKMHLYYYKCIQAIAENFENCKIFIIVDKTAQPIAFFFNEFVNQIDYRFSNFKQNPLQIIDVENLQNLNFKIIYNLENSKTYDWIVLENINFNVELYQSFSKNGFIAIYFDINFIKYQVLNSGNISLKIGCKKANNFGWKYYVQELHIEKGFKNNVYKLLFNYNIYLVKFLKIINKQELAVVNKTIKINNVIIFNKIFYYLQLLSIIIGRKFFKQKLNWKIAFQKNNKNFLINQPKDSFWADPFIVKQDGNVVLFFEELKPNNIGCISCAVLNDKFVIKEKKVVINKDYHLSFPNVFDFENNYYMIPESSAHNSLDIYKCDNFPFEWKFHCQLMDNIKLLDPVFLFFENKYWIFANKVQDFEFDNNEKLYLYYADNLFSKNWHPHPQNPVQTSLQSARNAGKIYIENNKMYRVSQNCQKEYGGNVVVNQILNLSTVSYQETIYQDILCPKPFSGMHTINFLDDLTVVDYLTKN